MFFNKKLHDILLSVLLWMFGGTFYFLVEVAYKTTVGHPDQISWTMLVLAVILCIPMERFGAELPWEMKLQHQALICAAMITVTEFLVGILLNVVLQLNIWDYSNLPGNLLGQICPQFAIIWLFAAFLMIVLFDYIRYGIEQIEKPRYYF